MSSEHFIKFLIILLPVFIKFINPALIEDLSIWIKLGQDIIATNQIPLHDNYSFLKTSEMIYPSWGISIALALLYNLGGLKLIFLVNGLILITCFEYMYRKYLANHDKIKAVSLILIILSIYTASIGFGDRPALYGLILSLATYSFFKRTQELTFKRLALINCLAIFWINIHASALLVFIFSFYYLLNRYILAKKLTNIELSLLPTIICSFFVTPFGTKIFYYILQTREISKSRGLTEWEYTLSFNTYYEQSILFLILVAVCSIFILKKKKIKSFLLDPYSFLILMGVISVRHTVFAGFLFIPFAMSNNLFDQEQKQLFKNKAFNSVICFALTVYLFMLNPFLKETFSYLLPAGKQKLIHENPAAEITYISKNHLTGNIFNQMELGSHLALMLDNKIMLDTRNIIFSHKDFVNYTQIIQGSAGWSKLLSSYNIKIILVKNDDERRNFISKISSSKDWSVIETSNKYFLAHKIK